MSELFWLSAAKERWQGMINKGIKPQAVIVNGASGVGKKALLHHIIPLMLCANSNEKACGQCQSCRLNYSGHHPDVLTIMPENHVVKVAMIRQLTDFFISTPHCSQHKIAVINQAHLMNNSAANALLKVLEEPPASGTLFLLSEAKHYLLPTIRSRCISLEINIPASADDKVNEWLCNKGHNDSDVSAIMPLMPGLPLAALACLETGVLKVFQDFLSDVTAVITGREVLVSVSKKWCDLLTIEHLIMWQELNLLILKQADAIDEKNYWSEHELSKLLKKQPQSADLIIKTNDLIQGFVLKFNTQLKKQLMLESVLFKIKQLIS